MESGHVMLVVDPTPKIERVHQKKKSRWGGEPISFIALFFLHTHIHSMVSVKRRLSTDESEGSSNNKVAKTDELSREQRQERVFANMRLRRIIKENHASTIHQLAFFFNNKNFSGPVGIDLQKTFDKRGSVQRDQTDTSNVLASVGGCQVHTHAHTISYGEQWMTPMIDFFS